MFGSLTYGRSRKNLVLSQFVAQNEKTKMQLRRVETVLGAIERTLQQALVQHSQQWEKRLKTEKATVESKHSFIASEVTKHSSTLGKMATIIERLQEQIHGMELHVQEVNTKNSIKRNKKAVKRYCKRTQKGLQNIIKRK